MTLARTSPRLIASALAACLGLGACADKPKPAAPPVAPQPPKASGPVPSTESTAPSSRTLGGVELGIVAEPVRVAAQKLSRDRKGGVAGLVAQGAAAHDAVLALLGSASLDELLGALEIATLPNDPAHVRGDLGPRLVPLLSHDAAMVRAAATQAAELVDDPQTFIALVKSDKPDVRRAGVRLLGRWDGPAVEDALVPLLRDESLGLDAALALSSPGKAKMASPKVIEAARAAVAADATPTALEAGLTVLRRLGQAAPPEAAARALESKDIPLAIEGVRASAGPILLGLGADPRPDVRRALAEEAARIDAGDARAALVEALAKDADEGVRAAAATALAKTDAGTGATMDALLGDPSEGVRRAAIAATATLPGPIATPRLAARLSAAAEDDRPFIVWALEAVPGREAADALIAALADKTVGPVAHIVLQRRSGKDLPAELAPWRAWADETYGAAPAPEAPKPEAPKTEAPKPK